MVKIIVDTFGGDRGHKEVVKGAVTALHSIADLSIILAGDKTLIEKDLEELKLEGYELDENRTEILHAPDEITCNDVPTVAIKKKIDSSLYKAFEALRNDEADALVSIGSTGAILAGAVLRIGRIKGVKRPAVCPILPTVTDSIVAICDSGANAECTPLYLQQFAVMGSIYLNKAYGIKNPRVALLNVGVEEEKGDTLRKETYQLLKETKNINFVGNMESRNLLSGDYDLVVCDGFSGNVLIKSTEGACGELLKLLKGAFTSNLKNKVGALLLKSSIYEIKNKMDYNNYGGAVLLGTTKTIVKGHGSSKYTAVYHCIEQAYNIEKNNLIETISESLQNNE